MEERGLDENHIFGPNNSLRIKLPIITNQNKKRDLNLLKKIISDWEMISKEELKEIYLVTHTPIYYNKNKPINKFKFTLQDNFQFSNPHNFQFSNPDNFHPNQTIPHKINLELEIYDDSSDSSCQKEELDYIYEDDDYSDSESYSESV